MGGAGPVGGVGHLAGARAVGLALVHERGDVGHGGHAAHGRRRSRHASALALYFVPQYEELVCVKWNKMHGYQNVHVCIELVLGRSFPI